MLDSAMIDGHAGLHLTHLAMACLGCGVCLRSAKWQEDMNFICFSHEPRLSLSPAQIFAFLYLYVDFKE